MLSDRYYTMFGLVIQSDEPIDELQEHERQAPDLIVRWNTARLPTHLGQNFREAQSGGNIYVTFGRADCGYLVHFVNQAEFWVSSNGTEILCRAEPDLYKPTFRHLFLDQALPLALSRRGLAAFHASAVEISNSAIAFAGASGQGKSTLAAYLVEQGGQLITDDCLVIRYGGEAIHVVPGYPGVRLWRDSLTFVAPQAEDSVPLFTDRDKHRYSSKARLADGLVRLRRFYFLQPATDGTCSIDVVKGAALIREIIGSQFLLDSEDPWELETRFQAATMLAGSGLCYRLTVPRDLSRLPECAARIAEHAGKN